MRSIVTTQFRKMLDSLPAHIQDEARAGFVKWKEDPKSVGWKRLTGMRADVHSVEIGLRWRAVGVVSKEHNAVVWFFVGSHEAYNNYIASHRGMSHSAWIKPDLKKRLDGRREEVASNDPARQPSRKIPQP